MHTTLAALAVITVGYILAYLVFERLRDRYGYVGGAEYVVIGFLLGPRVTGLLQATTVQELTPLVSLALGWMGMLLGPISACPPWHWLTEITFGSPLAKPSRPSPSPWPPCWASSAT